MTVHRITMPDAFAGDEPREIVWDSEAGTLAGDHSCVDGPWGLRARIDELAAELAAGDAPDRPAGIVVRNIAGYARVTDPWHDAGDFLAVCAFFPGVHLEDAVLPEALRGVELRIHRHIVEPGRAI